MAKMRAVQVSRRGGPLEQVEREVPQPRAGEARIAVRACGVCHSDAAVVEGALPGLEYPRVPGHEVAGVIDALGPGVTAWKLGDYVGVGWNGGYDGTCDACRRGRFFGCVATKITGASFDGGYAEHMIAPVSALVRLPSELSPIDAAPLMCAGVTTFNALRNSGARPGDLVAIHGIGGLGHLGVQFAARMGFRTVAIARGSDKEPLAKQLGATRYIDSQAVDPVEELTKLGGATAILATVTSGKAMSAILGGLGPAGRLIVIGATPDPIEGNAYALISGARSIQGAYSGTSIDSQDTAAFSLLTGVRSMNEIFPFSEAPQAYARMMSGKARFRVVLTMNG
ncbi:alcohol dehydrogenase [Sandaracinus amylolyticus]|uniref:alcohol dehydrogenase n=1 Tax=Sandaracinus amylolyticus TaxID=927083 RepID=UPI003AF34B96